MTYYLITKMTLWVSQSASKSYYSPKMSVDLESTLENTSRMMFYITRSNSSGHNSIGS